MNETLRRECKYKNKKKRKEQKQKGEEKERMKNKEEGAEKEKKSSGLVPQGACICRYLCRLAWGDDPQTRVHRWHKITGIRYFLDVVCHSVVGWFTACPDICGVLVLCPDGGHPPVPPSNLILILFLLEPVPHGLGQPSPPTLILGARGVKNKS